MNFSRTIFLTSNVGRGLTVSLILNVVLLSMPAQVVPGATQLLDTVTVTGRANDLLGVAASASQGQVGSVDLAARPFLRRGELLEVVPGVVITQHSGGGKANQYFLRGFNLDHGTDFAVTVDGMPVNMRTHGHGQGYADLNFIIPELVDRVDYRKGPYYADTGDFSAAGAASFHLSEALPQGLLKVEAGEFEHGRIVVADTVALSNGGFTYGIEAAHDDGPWLRGDDFRRGNMVLRRSWGDPVHRFNLTAMGYSATWDSSDQIPARAVEAGTVDRFGTIDPTTGGETSRASVSFAGRIAAAAATTRFNAYAIHYDLDLYSNFTYFLDDPVNGDQFDQRDRRWVLGGEAAQDRTMTWGDREVRVRVGVEARADLINEVGLYKTVARKRLSTVRQDEVDEMSGAVWADVSVPWTPWLRTDLGVRADGYRFDVTSDLAANSEAVTDAIVSPKIGLALGPWSGVEIYGNVGQSFHSNDARGAAIRVDPLSGDPAEPVDPLVKATGGEVGVRVGRGTWVSTVSLWWLELDSELLFVGDAGGTEANGATRRYGVEWANFVRPWPWLKLDADLSLTRARYQDAPGEDHIPNSIASVVTAGAVADLGAGWQAGLRLRYFGPQPLIEDNSARAPESTTANARLGWSGGAWSVTAEVLNVFDAADNDIAYFYESRLPGEPAGGVADRHFHPAEPRAVRVSVGYRF